MYNQINFVMVMKHCNLNSERSNLSLHISMGTLFSFVILLTSLTAKNKNNKQTKTRMDSFIQEHYVTILIRS